MKFTDLNIKHRDLTQKISGKKIVLNLSTVLYGGAGYFALQNHQLLLKQGYNSFLIVKDKPVIENINVIQYPNSVWENFIPKIRRMVWRKIFNISSFVDKYHFYNKFEKINCYSASRILKQLPDLPDVIFIYWVSGFINAKLLQELSKKTKAKIFIQLIDNAPITGGCHYPWNCEGYKFECKLCPAIKNRILKKLAQSNLAYKIKYMPDGITIIAATQSDFYRVKSSILFQNVNCSKILEAVDENKYKPAVSKKENKRYFKINPDEKVIFIGASFLNERRKGMIELLQAIQLIKKDNIILLIAGNAELELNQIPNIKVGYLSEIDLIKAYQASDVFVCPSLEDSGPLMLNQAIMCGTPVVAFKTGSAIDLVLTGKTGYLAIYPDIFDLAYGIDYVLSLNEEEYFGMSNQCRTLALDKISTNVYIKHLNRLINNNLAN